MATIYQPPTGKPAPTQSGINRACANMSAVKSKLGPTYTQYSVGDISRKLLGMSGEQTSEWDAVIRHMQIYGKECYATINTIVVAAMQYGFNLQWQFAAGSTEWICTVDYSQEVPVVQVTGPVVPPK